MKKENLKTLSNISTAVLAATSLALFAKSENAQVEATDGDQSVNSSADAISVEGASTKNNDGEIPFTETNMHSNTKEYGNATMGSALRTSFTKDDIDESGSTLKVHYLRMPTGLDVEQASAWLTFAKKQAQADYQKTKREQKIIRVAATTACKVFDIGDTSVPRVDAVDVASYQSWMTQSDFNKLKSLGVQTVIVKITQGTSYVNPYAKQEIKYAQNAGLNVAVYHYATFASPAAATNESKHFAATAKSMGLGNSVMMIADMEDSTVKGNVKTEMSNFWSALNSSNYSNHVVYTGGGFTARQDAIDSVGEARTWYARYPYTPKANDLWQTEYGAWQFSSTARVPGKASSVDVSIDYTGLFRSSSYDAITAQKSISYPVTVNESTRNDGLYTNGPYNTSVTTTKSAGSAKQYNGTNATVSAEATTKRTTWVKVKFNDGKTYWMDKRGISVNYEKLTSQKKVDYPATFNQSSRNDGLYADGPYMTSASTIQATDHAKTYNGQRVHVDQEAVTKRATWVHVQFANGKSYWLDKHGITPGKYNSVTNKVSKNYVVKIDQSKRNDGLFTGGPYQTTAASLFVTTTAKSLNGQFATVTAEEVSGGTTWAQIKLNNGKVYWIDKRALNVNPFDNISNQAKTDKVVRLSQETRNDGLYSNGPWNTSLTTIDADARAKSYNGRYVQAIATASTVHANWIEIVLNGKNYWMDERGVTAVTLDKIANQKSLDYVARFSQTSRNDGLYSSGPWNTSLATLTASSYAKQFNGEYVHVVAQATTSHATWLKVEYGSKTYWIDKRGISAAVATEKVTSKKTTKDYVAKFNQSKRNDGLFVGGPYKTVATAMTVDRQAKQYNGDYVHVISEEKTARATWTEIEYAGNTYWIDARGISTFKLDTISNKKNVNYTATVNQSKRNDGLYVSGPWATSYASLTASARAKTYNGTKVTVVAEETTQHATWARIKINGTLYWVDKRALKL